MSKEKHAYLIIAHHEFGILQKLIGLLDDARNDIYVHIDKKVKNLPSLQCAESKLYILEDRIDVRWGHVSQIESEYALFEAAYNAKQLYDRYHLISGVHLPLKNQNDIHDFFNKNKDKELLSFLYTNNYEMNFKLNRSHYFLKNYRADNALMRRIAQLLWHLSLKAQSVLGIKKNNLKIDVKANNWVSLTHLAIVRIINEKDNVLKLFRRTFCGDEFFVPYVLEADLDKFEIRNEQRLLFNEFVGSTPRVLTDADYNFLINSEYLFARKFSSSDMVVVNKIVGHLKSSL
ncbi:beta-1,6-N-acetylglucosaminyltransferase [Albibacterium indicum]|uniref:beta-1,6-N-acetylglucosaminyltransferase n=1 Tax=Albibacterium indicum TaxID=2292082 RepID=UPI000E486822|nr:beta-1,6-N-acetylglucosaminyltransferase [Pedobacter indicus]